MAEEQETRPPDYGRTVSDAMSGLSFDRNLAEWSEYTEKELERHFERFKEYDLDNTGFVTSDNLKAIMEALEVPCTPEQAQNIITEAGFLSDHENDGRLSFRDFMKCMDYEAKREAHNERVDSVTEAEEAGVAAPAEAAPEAGSAFGVRLRRSSLAAMDSLAASRIDAFQQAIKDQKKKEKAVPATPAQARFQNKLAKFQRIEDGTAPPKRNNDGAQQAAIKNKLAAFENAKKTAEDPAAFKRDWKAVSQGKWAEKVTQAPGGGAGVAPKKTFADLP